MLRMEFKQLYFLWALKSKQVSIIFFHVLLCLIGHKQFHKHNLYKSFKTFVWESEEGEKTVKLIFWAVTASISHQKYVF